MSYQKLSSDTRSDDLDHSSPASVGHFTWAREPSPSAPDLFDLARSYSELLGRGRPQAQAELNEAMRCALVDYPQQPLSAVDRGRVLESGVVQRPRDYDGGGTRKPPPTHASFVDTTPTRSSEPHMTSNLPNDSTNLSSSHTCTSSASRHSSNCNVLPHSDARRPISAADHQAKHGCPPVGR